MKNSKVILVFPLCVLALGLAFAACEDSVHFDNPGTTNPGSTTVAVTGVSLKSSTTILVGNTETLSPVISPSNATNQNVTWSSSNNAAATVSTYGTVTAVSAGSATITVTTADGGKKASCSVTVVSASIPVTGVSLNKSSISLTVGGAETLYETIAPYNATNQNIIWSSSNTAVATVSAYGIVTAVSPGSATITVTTVDGSKKATCSVSVSGGTNPGSNYGDLTYSSNGSTITITGYTGPGGSVTIPANIDGKPVTVIGERAFYAWSKSNKLTSVTIPNSVTTIEDEAFRCNQLTSIIIPSSVTSIKKCALANNQLTSVNIPLSVNQISFGAFCENNLTSVIIPNSITMIDMAAFSDNQLTSVNIPSSVTWILFGAFSNNKLTNVIIPNSVTYIDNEVFYDNQLTSVIIPDSVTSIGGSAFATNQLTSVVIGANVTLGFGWGYPFDNGFEDAYNSNGKTAGTYTRPNTASTVWTKQ